MPPKTWYLAVSRGTIAVISPAKRGLMGSGRGVKASASEGQLAKPERDRLVESHMPLVRSVARRYAGRGAEFEDLVQVGAVGLLAASERFDPQRGVSFGSFAAPTVEGAIRHHLRKVGQTDPPVAADEIPEGISALAGSDDRLLIRGWLRALSDRDRQIVYLRFHADMTEREIASEVGLSQAQVSRLLAEALVQLREVSGSDGGAELDPEIALHLGTEPVAPPTAAPVPAPSSKPAARGGSGDESAPSHSGRFLVRMDGVLHERLSDAARRDHVSLNRFVTERLAQSLSRTDTVQATERPLGGHLRAAMVANIAVIVVAATVAIVLVVLALERGL
jgi:RNA polymerase sigma-B factor